MTRWDARTGTARSIEPWMVSLDSPPDEAKYRCHWTAPMAIDPFDSKNVLYGCQLILKTSNGGQSWTELSPDLSTRDASRIVSNGGITGDNLGQYNGAVVWSIEYSKIKQGLIWAGTNDGKLWNTQDNGAHWNDLTKNFKDLQVEVQGQFGGLGLEVTMENGVVKVVSPIDDTPAAQAGLKPNDLIVAIQP